MILNVGDCVEMKLPNSRDMKVSCHVLAIVKDPDDTSEEGNMIVFRYWGNNKKDGFGKCSRTGYWKCITNRSWFIYKRPPSVFPETAIYILFWLRHILL